MRIRSALFVLLAAPLAFAAPKKAPPAKGKGAPPAPAAAPAPPPSPSMPKEVEPPAEAKQAKVRGDELRAAGDAEGAAAAYLAAIKIFADYAAAHHELGKLYFSRQKLPEAIEHFGHA